MLVGDRVPFAPVMPARPTGVRETRSSKAFKQPRQRPGGPHATGFRRRSALEIEAPATDAEASAVAPRAGCDCGFRVGAWVTASPLDHVWAEDQHETPALRLSDEIAAMVLLACGCAGYQWPRWRVIAVVAVAFVIPPIVADYAA